MGGEAGLKRERGADAGRRPASHCMSRLHPLMDNRRAGCLVAVGCRAFALSSKPLPPAPSLRCSPNPLQETYSIGGDVRPSPWAGRSFRVKVQLHETYPFKGPETGDIVFVDVPYHPNVMPDGSLCCDGLDWKPVKGLKHIAQFVQEALSQPSKDHFINAEAGKLLGDNLAAFEAKARTGDKRT